MHRREGDSLTNELKQIRNFLITYQFDDIERAKQATTLIQELGDAWHDPLRFEAAWCLKTDRSASEVKDHIATCMTADDHLLVVEMSSWATRHANRLLNWLADQE